MKCRVLTHSGTKRITASALAETKRRNEWSNADLADAMGCGEGTVRNRLSDDEPNHQMTVHELRRLIQAGELETANTIIADLSVHIEQDSFDCAADAMAAAQSSANCTAALIAAAPDGIDHDEWRKLIPMLEKQERTVSALLAQGRRVLAGEH